MYLGQQKILNTKEDGENIEVYLDGDKLEIMPKDLFEALKTKDKSEDLEYRKLNYVARILYTAMCKYGLSIQASQEAIDTCARRVNETLNLAVLKKFNCKDYVHGQTHFKSEIPLNQLHLSAYPEDK